MARPEVAPKACCEANTADLPGNKKEEKEKTMTDSNFEALRDLIVNLTNDIGNIKNDIVNLTNDIGHIKNDIKDLDKKVDVGFAKVDTGFAEVKGEIKRIDEKINGWDKRLENSEKISYTTLTALILAVVGGIAKFIFSK